MESKATSGTSHRIGGMAVVIGASMAGLCTAKILAERFDQVTIIDRDRLPTEIEWRHQVPQGRHPHLLLYAGTRLLEGWFPGIVDELEAAGAIDIDVCRDAYWYQSGGVMRRPVSTMRGPAMSRPLLEGTIRRRIEAIPHVTIREGAVVAGLQTGDSGSRVTGVLLDDESTVEADLVVDATGRQARSLAWLQALGYDPPPTSVVGIDTRYVTRLYRRGDVPAFDWKAAAVIGDPATKRLAVALPIEGDRWMVTVVGFNGESVPLDETDRLAYARTFDSPVIAEIMEASEPLGEPLTHRFPSDQRRHVEQLRRFPAGWVLIGDAICSYNPIYGQGMSSAALQAETLGASLDRSRAIDHAFARRFFRTVGKTVAGPWAIAVGGDFAYPGTTGKKPAGTDLLNRYVERVNIAAQHDDEVAIRFNEVTGLVRRTEWLLTPPFVFRVMRAARRGPVVPHADGEDDRSPELAQVT
jgi:2-polyprenyl-6-methoxyphenol hydroxylase-like FAD-dependent oxidoreductase